MITIYRREDSNTTPRRFGNKPTYSIDETQRCRYGVGISGDLHDTRWLQCGKCGGWHKLPL